MTTFTPEEIATLSAFVTEEGQPLAGLSEDQLRSLLTVPPYARHAFGTMLDHGLGSVDSYDPDVLAGLALLDGTTFTPDARLAAILDREGVSGLVRIGREGAGLLEETDYKTRTVNAFWVEAGLPVEALNGLTPAQMKTIYNLADIRADWAGKLGMEGLLTYLQFFDGAPESAVSAAGYLLASGTSPADVVSLNNGQLHAASRIHVEDYDHKGLDSVPADQIAGLVASAYQARRGPADYGQDTLDAYCYYSVAALLRAGVPAAQVAGMGMAQLTAASSVKQNNGSGLDKFAAAVGMDNVPAALEKLAASAFANNEDLDGFDTTDFDKAVAFAQTGYEYFAMQSSMGGAGRLAACGVDLDVACAMNTHALSVAYELGEGNYNSLAAFVDAWTPDGFESHARGIYGGGGELRAMSYLVTAGVSVEVASRLSGTALDHAYRAGVAFYEAPENLRTMPRDFDQLQALLESLPDDLVTAHTAASAMAGGLTQEEALELASSDTRMPFDAEEYTRLPADVSRRRVMKAALALEDPGPAVQLMRGGVHPSLVLGVEPLKRDQLKAKSAGIELER